jgi:transposase
MKECYYIGLDLHKKVIAYCIKKADGTVVDEGNINTTRKVMEKWAKGIKKPWIGAMEATLFTGWVYDFFKPYAFDLKVGHPLMLKAISASKKKSDRIDARKLADLVRCNWFPESYMAPKQIRDLRCVLRYRSHIVRESVRMQNKICGLLMESGIEYNKKKLSGKKYFGELLDSLDHVPESVIDMLSFSRSSMEVFEAGQKRLVKELRHNRTLKERVERLMTIPGVGEITALTWALEIADPHRFLSAKKAASYCGLVSAFSESAGKITRRPLSKQRNKHIQPILIQAAKLAPHWNPQLAQIYDQEKERGRNHNEATLAVARKLVAYLLYVDKKEKNFELKMKEAA